MRIFVKILLVMSGVLFVGCGGGGTSSNSVGSLTYNGKTTKAELDKKNSNHFLLLMQRNFTNNVIAPMAKKVLGSDSLVSIEQKVLKFLPKKNKVIDSDSRDGKISGTVSVVVEETGATTGKITTKYKNFSDVKGIVLNGTVLYSLTVNSNEVVTKNVADYQLLHMQIQKDDITIDGTVTSLLTEKGKKSIENYLIKNNKTSEMLKFENFTALLNSQLQPLSYSGKIYDSNYGYVEVKTVVSLGYDENNKRMPEGEVHFEGEASNVTVRYAYDNRIRLEIDENKDGTVDNVQVYQEGNYEEEIPNAKPVVKISFPKSIYTDTDMSQVKVDVYDPDLDGFSTSYEWSISGAVSGTGLVLDNTLFVKHDKLELTVVAEDDRVGDSKTSTEIKKQEVLNSAPKIILELDKTTIEVGEKIVVDASKSYDVDGDDFTFEWSTQNRQYSIHGASYNLNHKYLDINETNKSKVNFMGEDVNYYYVDYSIKPYGIRVTLDDSDIGGTVTFDSENIFVNTMDLFNRELITLRDQNILTNAITAMTISDLNNDGLKDIVIVTDTYGDEVDNEKLIILMQNSTHSYYVEKKIKLASIAPYTYNSITTGDFNNDGFIDIAYTAPTMKGFSVYFQNATGNYIQTEEYLTNKFPYVSFPTEPDMVDYISNSVDFLVSADMNNDEKMDIVTIGKNAMTGGSTGMNIFLQNDINLTDSKMLVLDNRTIEDDGQYEITDSHNRGTIKVSNIDNDNMKDIVVENYVEYQENNGSYTEKIYKEVDSITFIDTNTSSKKMIGLKSFDNELIIYQKSSFREYAEDYIRNILVPNSNRVLGYSQNKDLLIGHDGYPYFTLLVQGNTGFYGDQIYKLSDSNNIGYGKTVENLIVDDLNNDGKQDIILIGERGFEIFYLK